MGGEDMICCSDLAGEKVSEKYQKPLYKVDTKSLTLSSINRKVEFPCSDHSWMCLDWLINDPESCTPGHPSYVFMREACPLRCGRCKNMDVLTIMLNVLIGPGVENVLQSLR